MPALLDNQDPESLPARVAFHLHVLGVSTTALKHAAQLTRVTARQLRDGQVALMPSDANWLHAALGLDDNALTRPLTEEESRDWRFFRTSVRHGDAVWNHVARAISAARMSHTDAADIMGLDRPRLVKSLQGHPGSLTLLRPPASNLAAHLALPDDAETFLHGLPTYPRERER